MAIQIGARPDSGFDDPIGMLKDCHRRIERFAELLQRVAEQAEGRPLMAEEREAVERALGYFRESGPRHNRDEEESLFPRMQADAKASAEIERLESEHVGAAAMHEETADLYAEWIERNILTEDEGHRLRTITRQLTELYRDHIRIEEESVFPKASAMLDDATLLAMGAEFRRRRSERPD